MKVLRRQFLHWAGSALALPAMSRIARAQSYPARPVHLIVSVAAGGSPDIIGRLIAQWLSERLGQPFVVDNRAGAASNIGTEFALKAAPDGYTLLLALSSNAINASLYKDLQFNFIRDAAPVASIATIPLIMEVNPSVPVKTIPEFIAYAKANPGKDQYGLRRHRLPASRRRRTVQDDGRRRPCPRAIPQRGAGAARSPCRPGATFIRGHARVARLCQGRQIARAGRHDGQAPGALARCPRRGRVSAGLRGERVVWHRRAQGHTQGDR